MADFAKAQLLKYGWTEGKGLGKNENGITEALRPKLKFNTTGIGHKEIDANPWWESAFNKAANNITVEAQTNGISFSVSQKDEPTTEKLVKKKSKDSLEYKNFLKTSTLHDGKLFQEEGVKETIVASGIIHIQLTDDELFKACGGRTAHKGARHGLKLNGKLERVAQQDKELMNFRTPGKNREKNKDRNEEPQNAVSDMDDILDPTLSPTRKMTKTARKMYKRRLNNLTEQLNISCNVSDENKDEKQHAGTNSKRRKDLKRSRQKKENRTCDDKTCTVNLEVDYNIYDIPLPGGAEEKVGDRLDQIREEETPRKNKKKKSKRKRSQSRPDKGLYFLLSDQEIIDTSPPKKSKKSQKKDGNFVCTVKEPASVVDCKLETDSSYETEKDYASDSAEILSRKDVRRLNNRILKKKAARLRKKNKPKLMDRITDSLKAVHFDKESDSNASKTSVKLETIIADTNTLNITEDLKKTLKKSKKSKK